MSLIFVPLRKPIISGIPDPAAAGWYKTKVQLATTKITEYPTVKAKAPVKSLF